MTRYPYDHYPGIDAERFVLPTDGRALTAYEYRRAIENVRAHVERTKPDFFGYQANQSLDYSGLAEFLDVQLNNLGGPFTDGGFRLNVKWVERALLDYFAWLWHAKAPWDEQDEEAYWGYVLSMGSTEGNLYGLWNAREYLAGESILEDDEQGSRSVVYTTRELHGDEDNHYRPVALYSQDIHYSIGKALRALKVPTVGEMAKADPSLGLDPAEYKVGVPTHGEEDPEHRGGEVDLDKLAEAVKALVARHYPVMIVFNYGTAFRGAYDDVDAAVARVNEIVEDEHGSRLRTVEGVRDGKPWKDERTWTWYHVDGALGAPFARYLPATYGMPRFDFEVGVHSISCSGHKWMGAPWPCGVFMTRRNYQLRPEDVTYIGGSDTTFAGSRNGLSTLVMWSYLARTGVDENVQKAIRLQELAEYAHVQLVDLDAYMTGHHATPLYVARTRRGLTIRLRKLSDALIAKFSLSNDTVSRTIDGERRLINVSHIFVMDHVDEALIDRFVAEIKAAGSNAVHPEFIVQQSEVASKAVGFNLSSTNAGFHS